jgi:hypothetical protein
MVDIFGWSLNGELDILRVKPICAYYIIVPDPTPILSRASRVEPRPKS